jgi:serine/threonine protein kinase
LSFCINPWCLSRQNSESDSLCLACGTSLLINDRFRLIRPIVDLTRPHPTEVFEALDLKGSFNCPPNSIKVLKVLKSSDGLLRDLFKREADALRVFDHPSIPFVDIEDYFTIGAEACPIELRCLAMSKIEGITLDQWILQQGRLSQDQGIKFLREISEILHYVHQEGYFHRDLKPQNIIVRPDESIALIDFGGIRQASDTYMSKMSLGRQMTRIHTLSFTPPEQINGRAVPQSDFYAIGRTFIYALTGKEFCDIPDNKAGDLSWHQFARHIDKPLLRFIDRMTQRSVAQRPQSTQEILDFLNKTLPQQLKWYRFVRSKLFKFSCIALAVFLIACTYKLYQNQQAEYRVSQAKEKITLSNKSLDLGSKLLRDHKYQSARAELEKSIKLHPNYDAYMRLGTLCSQTEDPKCETDSYDAAIELDKNRWEAYFSYGGYYEDSKTANKYSKAEKSYRKALSSSKVNSALILNNLARILILQGKYNEALLLVINGLSETREPYYNAVLYKNQGWIYFASKDYQKAEESLKLSISLEKNLTSSHCLLAQVVDLRHQDSVDEWTDCFSVVSEDTNNSEVKQWKKTHLSRLNR